MKLLHLQRADKHPDARAQAKGKKYRRRSHKRGAAQKKEGTNYKNVIFLEREMDEGYGGGGFLIKILELLGSLNYVHV